jgi:spermidine synthase
MTAPSIEISEERGIRYLHFGSHWIQGAMRVSRPWALELEYTRDMMIALLLRPGAARPRHVLIIGLGAASQPKFLYRNRPHARLTVIEIDPAVVRAAEQHFGLPDDPRRLAIEIADGHDYVTSTRRRFDLIVVDGFDAKCNVGMLDTTPFYSACRGRLTDEGLFVTNFLNRRRGLAAGVKRMDAAFDERTCVLPECSTGNVIALAAAGKRVDVSLTELKAGALAMKRDTGLNLSPLVARLAKLQAGISERFQL